MKKKASVFRKLPILLAMIMLLISCAGCGERYKIEEGFHGEYFSEKPSPIRIGIRSKTDTFDKNDVTFDVSYGLFELGDDHPVSPYHVKADSQIDYYDDVKILFAVYVRDRNAPKNEDIRFLAEFSDYKALDHYVFVKEITHEQAFSEEYGYTNNRWTGKKFNHSETITIPQEVISAERNEEGSFYITIFAYQIFPKTEGSSFCLTGSESVQVKYVCVDDQLIRLTEVD